MIASLMCVLCGVRVVCKESSHHCGRCKGGLGQTFNTNQARRLPRRPTNASPGSREKVEIMRGRYERGEHLYHPLDNRVVYKILGRGPKVKTERGNTSVDTLSSVLGYDVSSSDDGEED